MLFSTAAHLVERVIVALSRHVPAPPVIPFEFADKIHAIVENIEIRQPVFRVQIALYPRDARKEILIDVGIDENIPLVEKLADALHARQGMLLCRAVDERPQPSPAVRMPAEHSGDALDLLGVIIDVPARGEMLVHRVYVVVVIDRIPMRGERVVEPGVYGNGILPLPGQGERLTCEKSKQK